MKGGNLIKEIARIWNENHIDEPSGKLRNGMRMRVRAS